MAKTELHRRRHGDEEVPRHVYTYVRSLGGALEPGTYYCYLKVSGKLAKGLSVRSRSQSLRNRRRLAQVDLHLVRDVLGKKRGTR